MIIETKYSIGDKLYRTDDSLFQDAKTVTSIIVKGKEGETKAFYYLGGCNAYAESSLRTKQDQIIAIQAEVVKFIQREK